LREPRDTFQKHSSRLGVLWRLIGDAVVVNLAGTGLFGALMETVSLND
jgi:hypothetical protein